MLKQLTVVIYKCLFVFVLFKCAIRFISLYYLLTIYAACFLFVFTHSKIEILIMCSQSGPSPNDLSLIIQENVFDDDNTMPYENETPNGNDVETSVSNLKSGKKNTFFI